MIGTVAFLFPVVLLAIGTAFGLPVPGSISEYYWYPSADSDAPVRVFFVGGLYTIGAFLIGYRGYTKGKTGSTHWPACAPFASRLCRWSKILMPIP
jgi:Zn-dependent protease